jgi:lipopolysaccharide assembly outer membrane protein LptD (OstA)
LFTRFLHIILSILFLTIGTLAFAQEIPNTSKPIPAKPAVEKDSVIIDRAVLKDADLLKKPADSVKKDSVQPRSSLEFILDTSASDYKQIDRRKNTVTLYNNAVVTYGDIKIEAGKIVINNSTGDIYAYGIVEDSTQAYVQKPIFTQGTNIVKPDSIIANKDSKKVITYNSNTKQAEFNVNAEIVKRVNDSVFYMRNARFTTSENPEDPEYYFLARKIKFVPGKKIVTGLVNMYIADVPTPLGLPFAYFPMTNERKSGVIIPAFGNNNSQGYFLQNGGYYFAVNDYLDLTLLGDYFTNGSYGFRAESSYRKRYSFSGSVRLLYENQLRSERGFSDFSQTSRYNFNWQHSQDAKSNPSSRFSASVNLGSSQFYRESFNQINQAATLNNNLSSSISYSKTFEGEPQMNISTSATHNQNVNTGEINLTLPTVQGSISRIYPFAPKEGAKSGIIENINLQYNLRAENRITTNDEDFLTGAMFDDAVMGVTHTIPVATNFKLGFFSISGNANYEENWVFETIRQTLVDNGNGGFATQRDTISGFDAYRTYSYGASVGTTIYGTYQAKDKESRIQAVRHIIRPNISYSANPSFEQYYDRLLDERGLDVSEEERLYSRFEGTYAGAPGRVFSSSVGIGIQNNIEAKVRDRDSTKTELKKVQILKSLNFNTAYNLAGDSLNWSPLQVRGVIPITKTVDLNLDANLDPYALDNLNNRVSEFNIDNGGSLFRLTRAGARINFKLSDKDFSREEENEEEDTKVNDRTLQQGGRDDDLFGEAIDYAENQKQREPEEQEVDVSKDRYRFKIPWSLNVAYTVTYNNAQRQNEIGNQSLMFSGDLELSPRWSIGGNSGYDFARQGISFTTLRFQRDLESWRLSFNWTPIGPRDSWFFFIGIKAGALSDIKWDQRKQPDPVF